MQFKPVQSLQRGLALIEAVSRRREGVSLKELAAVAGCSSAAAFHLVRTLVAAGYVRRLEDPARYVLGDKLQMLVGNQQQDRFYQIVQERMIDLYHQLPGSAIYFAEYIAGSVAVRHQVNERTGGMIQQSVNHVLPPYTSAGSAVHLAYWSPSQQQRYMELYDYESYGRHFWGPWETFQAHLDAARQQGAILMPEKQPTHLKLGLPILNLGGVLMASLTVQWNQPDRQGLARRKKQFLAVALDAGRHITQALGAGERA